ncbi:hypothetical protein ACMFMG_004338 [Clarireedia jacksonii]
MAQERELKRKRSRPSNWWEASVRAEADGLGGTDNGENAREVQKESQEVGEIEKEKKTGRGRGGGRPSLNAVVRDETQEVGSARDAPERNEMSNAAQNEDGIQKKKKGGRPSLAPEAVANGDVEVDPPKRRGRSSIMESETEVAVSAPFGGKRKERMGKVVQADDAGEGSAQPGGGKKRGRPAGGSGEVKDRITEGKAAATEGDGDAAVKRKRARPSLGGNGEEKQKTQVAEEGSKKRGRKPNAAAEAQSAERDAASLRKERQPQTDVEEDEDVREPKRRARPSNKENEKPVAEDAGTEERSKKKGRPTKENEAPSVDQSAKELSKKHDKRDQENEDPLADRPAKERRRQPRAEHDENDDGAPAKQSKERRKKRQNHEVVESEGVESSQADRRSQEESAEVPAKGRKKRDEQITESSAQQVPSKAKKRVRISDASETIKPSSSKPKSKTSRPEDTDEPRRKRKDKEDLEEQQPKPKRQRAEEQRNNQAEIEKPEKPPSYRHLAAVTRRVSRETIDAKWEPLPPGCLEKISNLLVDVQRPVVLQVRDERKKTQASTAIQMISRRLLSKVRKGMPFPKSTRTNREDDFDFEKILDYNLALEARLTPVLHSNELLESELRKEEILLENEQKYLADLEVNAKDEALKRRQTARKAHPLLQSEESIPRKELDDILGLDADQSSSLATLDTSKYPDLEEIMKSISGHVGSIQSNLEQIEGIGEAMTKTKAAVQATLFNHLDREQYDDVVLG